MEWLTVSSILVMGLGWGMLHAFDPDHLAAVAGVSASDRSSNTNYFYYALYWASGHGAAIASIAFLVFFFGVVFPPWFSEYAENSVSFILIAAGGLALVSLLRNRQVHIANDSNQLSRHGALVVGLVHGTAGSAPLLALIPLVNIDDPLVGMAYVLCFSAGVLAAMTASGSLLSYSIKLGNAVSRRYQSWVRAVLAIFSIMVGLFLLT